MSQMLAPGSAARWLAMFPSRILASRVSLLLASRRLKEEVGGGRVRYPFFPEGLEQRKITRGPGGRDRGTPARVVEAKDDETKHAHLLEPLVYDPRQPLCTKHASTPTRLRGSRYQKKRWRSCRLVPTAWEASGITPRSRSSHPALLPWTVRGDKKETFQACWMV